MKSGSHIPTLAKLLLAWTLMALPLFMSAQRAQEEEPATRGLAFGVLAHSYGFGIDVQYHLIRDDHSLVFSTSFASYKDPRELKIQSAYADQGGKRYIYDKKNYAYVLAPTFGYSKNWISNSGFSKVGLSTTFSAGPTLAFLKPYYLEVAIPFNGNQAFVEVDRYDASLYNYTNIVGEADYFLGLNELRVQPGFRAEISTMIDLAGTRNLIRGIEVSGFADIFAGELDIFDIEDNRQFWIGGSIEFLIGNTW